MERKDNLLFQFDYFLRVHEKGLPAHIHEALSDIYRELNEEIPKLRAECENVKEENRQLRLDMVRLEYKSELARY